MGGTVIVSPNRTRFEDGETVTLTAVADAGYDFSNWMGDETSSSSPVTIVMDADKTIGAVFSEVTAIATNQAELTMFPVPCNDVLHLRTNIVYDQIVFTNMIGQRVKTEKRSNNSLAIHLGELPQGIYYIQLMDGDELKAVRKIVKE